VNHEQESPALMREEYVKRYVTIKKLIFYGM
jgi:hypothetical protein